MSRAKAQKRRDYKTGFPTRRYKGTESRRRILIIRNGGTRSALSALDEWSVGTPTLQQILSYIRASLSASDAVAAIRDRGGGVTDPALHVLRPHHFFKCPVP